MKHLALACVRRETSERGYDSVEPVMRGIQDKDGRLMVVMTFNTDISDA